MRFDEGHVATVARERRRIPGILAVRDFLSRPGAIRWLPENGAGACAVRDAGAVRGPLGKDFVERFEGEPERRSARDVVRPDVVVDRKDSRRDRSAVWRDREFGIVAAPGRQRPNVAFAVDLDEDATVPDAGIDLVDDSPVIRDGVVR